MFLNKFKNNTFSSYPTFMQNNRHNLFSFTHQGDSLEFDPRGLSYCSRQGFFFPRAQNLVLFFINLSSPVLLTQSSPFFLPSDKFDYILTLILYHCFVFQHVSFFPTLVLIVGATIVLTEQDNTRFVLLVSISKVIHRPALLSTFC